MHARLRLIANRIMQNVNYREIVSWPENSERIPSRDVNEKKMSSDGLSLADGLSYPERRKR